MRVVERRLGSVPWLVAHGPAADAFASLGAHLRTEIRAVVEGLPGLAALRRHVASEPGRHRLAAVCRATQSRCPGPWAEHPHPLAQAMTRHPVLHEMSVHGEAASPSWRKT